MTHIRITLLLIITAQIFLGSCSMNQKILIETEGSGSVRMRIELKPALVNYLRELSELTENPLEEEIFDVQAIRRQFPDNQEVELKDIATPKPEILELDMAFRRIDAVFPEEEQLKGAGILSFNQQEGRHFLRVHLDRRNFRQLLSLFPFLENPVFEGLGPQENDNTTEEEYLELIELAMGEEGRTGLESSYLDILVTVKGTILSQHGGSLSRQGVRFRIPLIRVLLLDRPLDYWLEFR